MAFKWLRVTSAPENLRSQRDGEHTGMIFTTRESTKDGSGPGQNQSLQLSRGISAQGCFQS